MSDQTGETFQASFHVSGMSCQHCVAAVTAEVSAVAGVREVVVNLAAGTVEVRSDAPVDRGAVAAAVDEAGYELVS